MALVPLNGTNTTAYTWPTNCAPSTGNLSTFMLFVDFEDQPAQFDESPQHLRDFYVPGASEWYEKASYGKLHLQVDADTSRFYRMPASAESYGLSRGFDSNAHATYLLDAIDSYENATGKTVPASDVLYVVAARSAWRISQTAAYMTTSLYSRSGHLVSRKAVTFGQDAYDTFNFKALNHETGHTMCLPDLYLESGSAQDLTGGFDLMGWINGQSNDYFAWMKWKLNWIADEQVDCVTASGSTTHTIYPLERDDNQVKAVVVKRKDSDTQALIAEVRTTEGVNNGSCVTGVLLYTVDTTIASIEGPVKVLDAHPETDGCDAVPKNDAVLTNGTSYNLEDWDLNIMVTGQDENVFTIQLDYS
ncbi:hypothetical protein N0V95_007327 [Ascochyta clinopodiicola]|nr:hypothetical protein N0V95_007327 [Ascochyta clinopodiicola]